MRIFRKRSSNIVGVLVQRLILEQRSETFGMLTFVLRASFTGLDKVKSPELLGRDFLTRPMT
jgi:hypothetical protein